MLSRGVYMACSNSYSSFIIYNAQPMLRATYSHSG